MNTVRLLPGDRAIINGVEVWADRSVTLTSEASMTRLAAPGIVDLPETSSRIRTLWPTRGHRVPMVLRQDLRCPCGSVYVRRSSTHHSCQYCGRVWMNAEVPA
jgi:hypothetical protein